MPDDLFYAPLPSRALIAVSGPDWRGFLQNLLTQDVEGLAPGEARFGALLTPQGRLLYDLFIVGREDGCWLDVAAEHCAAAIQRLMLYRLRAKVEIATSDAAVASLFPGDKAAPHAGWAVDPRLAELGWRGYGAQPPKGVRMADEAVYDAQRLAFGVPGPGDWGVERAFPLEANFDLLHGIDFKKGCFVGQETTSRMKRRGQVKSRMLPISFEGPPPAPRTEVLAQDLRAGEVLSGREGRAMALLRLDRIAGAQLTAAGRPVRVDWPTWLKRALGEAA